MADIVGMADINKIQVKSEMGKNYIVVSAKDEWQDTIAAKMLQNNDVMGILPFECRHIDNNFYFYFPVPFFMDVGEVLKAKNVCLGKLISIYEGIIDVLKRGSMYFLREQGFVIKKEWMFWDDAGKEIFLCYIPGVQNDIRADIINFTEDIIKIIDIRDRDAAKFLYGVYDGMTAGGSLYSDGNVNVAEVMEAIILPFNKAGNYVKDSGKMECKPSRIISKNIEKKSKSGFLAIQPCSHELRNEFMEKWGVKYFLPDYLEGDDIEITVGRGSGCNMLLPYSCISRMHAKICYSGGEFYVTDTVSKNGTYLNGKRLAANKKTPLHLHDRLAFANLRFIMTEVSVIEK